MIRLNKYLAQCGLAARRKCDELIRSGQISVNGKIERQLGVKIDESIDQVMFHNNLVKPIRRHEYVLLNKPKGVLTTASDEKGRKTVFDVVNIKNRLFPVGRLDRDTSGLLLLTNDGDLAYKLTHPKYEIEKRYRVWLDRSLQEEDRLKLQNGIHLEEGVTSSCEVNFPQPEYRTIIVISIRQGWKRQIRRMFETLGYSVKKLHRTNVASLTLTGTKPGSWRFLSNPEISKLKRTIYDSVD